MLFKIYILDLINIIPITTGLDGNFRASSMIFFIRIYMAEEI